MNKLPLTSQQLLFYRSDPSATTMSVTVYRTSRRSPNLSKPNNFHPWYWRFIGQLIGCLMFLNFIIRMELQLIFIVGLRRSQSLNWGHRTALRWYRWDPCSGTSSSFLVLHLLDISLDLPGLSLFYLKVFLIWLTWTGFSWFDSPGQGFLDLTNLDRFFLIWLTWTEFSWFDSTGQGFLDLTHLDRVFLIWLTWTGFSWFDSPG